VFRRGARLPSLQSIVEGGVIQRSILTTHGRVIIQKNFRTSVQAKLAATNEVCQISLDRKAAFSFSFTEATSCCAITRLAYWLLNAL
jgi:hypothetical protein